MPPGAQTILVDGLFQLKLPKDFVKASEEEDDFTLYASVSSDQYVQINVLSNDSSQGKRIESLEEWAQNSMQLFEDKVEVQKNTELAKRRFGAMEARVQSLEVKKAGSTKRWTYWFAFLKGEFGYYAIRIWTPTERTRYFEETARAIFHTSKEEKVLE